MLVLLSPTGSDAAAGTLTAPWRTLSGARDRIRSGSLNADMSADLGICLRGGRYSLTDTFTLGNADSGTDGHRVVYTAYLGETPVIDGGKAVRGWTKVEGKPYWSANVSTSAGYAPYFRQLYVDGVRARLATSKAIAGTAFFDDPGTPFAKDGVVFPAASWKNYSNLTDVRLVQAGCGFKGDNFPVAGVTETDEIAATGSEGWVQYDFPHDYENLTFRFQNDNGGTCMATAWKVQRWSSSQNAWVDVMPYQAISTSGQVVYTPASTMATTKIRLYVKNGNAGGPLDTARRRAVLQRMQQ